MKLAEEYQSKAHWTFWFDNVMNKVIHRHPCFIIPLVRLLVISCFLCAHVWPFNFLNFILSHFNIQFQRSQLLSARLLAQKDEMVHNCHGEWRILNSSFSTCWSRDRTEKLGSLGYFVTTILCSRIKYLDSTWQRLSTNKLH